MLKEKYMELNSHRFIENKKYQFMSRINQIVKDQISFHDWDNVLNQVSFKVDSRVWSYLYFEVRGKINETNRS